jgi:hypothetical protein
MNITTYPLPPEAAHLMRAAQMHLDDYMAHLVDQLSEQVRIRSITRALRELRTPVDLSGLMLLADTACELDAYRSCCEDDRNIEVADLVKRLHTMVEQAAGERAGEIYAEGGV